MKCPRFYCILSKFKFKFIMQEPSIIVIHLGVANTNDNQVISDKFRGRMGKL